MATKEKTKPGLMIYHDDYMAVFDSLNDEEAGALFKAILKYSATGEVQAFDNRLLTVLLNGFIPRINSDADRYNRTSEARKRSAEKRWAKEGKNKDIDANSDDNQPVDSESKGMQTNANDANNNNNYNNSNSNNNNNNYNNNNSNKHIVTRHKYGAYNNVLLSDAEVDKVKAEFPYDYQSRIENLSEYMASSGKSYRNHLATIRSWARKEAAEQAASKGRYQKREVIPMVLDDPLPF